MAEHRLYAWGANSHGQLGLGYTSEQAEEPQLVSHVVAEDVVKVVGGAGHTLLLNRNGQVYSCGWNDKGQAGQTTPTFQQLKSLEDEKIIDVACGWDSSIALTDNGKVYTWGSNSFGQLGLTSIPIGGKTTEPLQVNVNASIIKISMGLRHSALVTDAAEVLVSGAAAKGQLGIAVGKLSSEFVKVSGIQNVRDVSCGQYYTVVITRDDKVFVWGDNRHGQLGVDPTNCKVVQNPLQIEGLPSGGIQRIYCGWTHSVLLTADRRVLTWGRNSYGQLGRGESTSEERHWKAQALAVTERIQQLAVGSEHNVALTENGSIISWGWNEHGNCGNGDTNDIFVPTKVSLPAGSGTLVGTGAGHSFAIVRTPK